MKYCTKCGNELMDDAVICPKCGCAVEGANIETANSDTTVSTSQNTGMKTAIKVFLILGCIAMACCTWFIGLAWCIPMTIYYFKQLENKKPVGTAFKVCTLLFVSLVAGILMLCDKD